MKALAAVLMALNGVVFFLGAVLHVGVVIGPFEQPRILPAAFIQVVCGVCLLGGAGALAGRKMPFWWTAVTMNIVALVGLLMGAIGRFVHRGLSWDVVAPDHRLMLALVVVCLLLLTRARSGFLPRSYDYYEQ